MQDASLSSSALPPPPSSSTSPAHVPQLASSRNTHTSASSSSVPLLDLSALKTWLEGGGNADAHVRLLPATYLVEDAVSLIAMEECLQRPDDDVFFLVNVSFPLQKFLAWQTLFPRIQPFFAVKCCPNPVLVRALASIPICGFDCASVAELELVLQNEVGPERIIFANPCKTAAAIEYALFNGIKTMTFDSVNELEKIASLLPVLREKYRAEKHKHTNVATDTGSKESLRVLPEPELVLRIRVPDEQSDVPLGAKYGAQVENCAELIDRVQVLGLCLVGVSFHCGSGSHSAAGFCEAIRLAKSFFELAEEKGVQLQILDIGGGWPGYDGLSEPLFQGGKGKKEEEALPLSVEAIAKEVRPLIDELFPELAGNSSQVLKIISEPGRFFVEGSHLLFTQICARRWVNAEGMPVVKGSDQHEEKKRAVYVVGEGCTGCFKDALLCGESFEPHPFALHKGRDDKSANDDDTDGVMYESLVVGPSGEAWDCIAGHGSPLLLPLLQPGDWFFFTRAGAYSASIASANSHVHANPGRAYTYIATTSDLPEENSM